MTEDKKPPSNIDPDEVLSRVKKMHSEIDPHLLSWVDSKRLDKNAAYAQGGRPHSGLTNEELIEAWKTAFRAMANDVRNDNRQAEEQNLKAEIELRSLVAPYVEVIDAVKALISVGRQAAEELERDCEACKRADEILTRELIDFKNRSKN
jgi:hypothetical protein